MVYPSGVTSTVGRSGSLWDDALSGVTGFVGDQFRLLGGWLAKILSSIAQLPLHVGVMTTEIACSGLGKLDDLTSLDDVSGPAPPVLVDEEGRLRVNAATSSKREGSQRCHRISSPVVSTCERDTDMIVQGECTRLPELRLNVRAAEFIRPPENETYMVDGVEVDVDDGVPYREYQLLVPPDSYFQEHGERDFVAVVNAVAEGFAPPMFDPVADLSAEDPPRLTNRNRGLTRAYVDWDFRWDVVSPDVYDRIDGFAVFLHPDQKSVPYVVPEQGFDFYLPKWVFAQVEVLGGDVLSSHHQVDEFSVGGLTYYPTSSDPRGPWESAKGSSSLVHLETDESNPSIEVVGSAKITGYYHLFNNMIGNMPLAPGFTHGFRVAAYVGEPGDPSFKLGPLSDMLILSGDDVACDNITEPEALVEEIGRLYDCPGSSPVILGYTDDEFRPGLLALTGTDMCDDIFSSTPAGFTWDNPVVKLVWNLSWIIAGALLFTLLVWQGLRMTYDIWLDPQPAIGFRELVPRFFLALLLAWGSLFLCRAVLVVASDLTCFVAQFTGMSMWGAVGVTFGYLMDGFMAWYQDMMSSILGATVVFLLGHAFLMLGGGLIVLLVMLYLFYLFVKVFLGMLLRIALLAVLIALAPVAFAFFASDATSHWTKKWLGMFLGATFQQVLVLVVIYIGVSMIGDYLSRGTDVSLVDLVVGMILTFITLSLAAAVPDIVNPGAKGIFSGFTQMAGMAMAAGMVVASAGVGAVMGGAAAATSAARGAGGAGGGPAAPPDAGGPAAPPDAGGRPAGGPAGSPGLISSVNRSSMGPGMVQLSGTPLQGQTSGQSQSVSGQPAGQPVVGQPGGQPVAGQPAGQPATGQPVAGQPAGQPATGQPVAGQPAGQPATGQPAAGQPGGQPAAGEPATQPVVGQPVVGQPAAGEPATGEPGGGRSGAGQPAAGGALGFLGQVARGVGRGWTGGARWGAGMNTRASNLAQGRSFYRHSSRGDDAADQLHRLRQEQSEERGEMMSYYRRIANALDPEGSGGS